MHNPRTKYKRSKTVFAVTSMALIIGRDWPRLVQPLAQSLIGSPGTLVGVQSNLIPKYLGVWLNSCFIPNKFLKTRKYINFPRENGTHAKMAKTHF